LSYGHHNNGLIILCFGAECKSSAAYGVGRPSSTFAVTCAAPPPNTPLITPAWIAASRQPTGITVNTSTAVTDPTTPIAPPLSTAFQNAGSCPTESIPYNRYLNAASSSIFSASSAPYTWLSRSGIQLTSAPYSVL